MRRGISALAVVVACAGLAAGVPAPASAQSAATGTVLVFQYEGVDATRYVDPEGCQQLPAGSHVLANLTDSDVTIYGDPYCMAFSMVVPPGNGAHVPPAAGSFSA
jgi:hypothetical protein